MSYELLLQAALAETGEATRAWEQYCQQTDPQQADHASIALFPWIYRRYQPSSFEYKSVYRYVWYSNQIQLKKLKQVLDNLHKASVEVCLLFAYDPEVWIGRMGDLEILVPAHQRQKTLDCLGIRIHTSLFPESRIDPLFKNFTYRQIPAPQFPTAMILSPEDQLLIALFRGLTADWIVQAVMILRTNPLFQWDYFVAQVQSVKLEYALYQALVYLAQNHFIKIPAPWMGLFSQYIPIRRERSHYKFLKRKCRNLLSTFQLYWHTHHRNATSQNLLVLLCTFPSFCKKSKGFTCWSDLLFFLGRKIFLRKR